MEPAAPARRKIFGMRTDRAWARRRARRPRGRVAAAAVSLAAALLAACSPAGGPTPDADSTGPVVHDAAAGLPRPAHVVVVVFENKPSTDVIGSKAAPYLTGLASGGAYFTRAHGVAHPSEPNYLALFSGSTHGVASDTCPLHLGGGPNLARELHAAGDSFVGYAEGLPHAGFQGCTSGGYARKHAPWADFTGLPAGTARPLSAIPRQYARLPTVAFVVPNLCHDMHDCAIRTGDSWARAHLSRYVRWARTHHSLLVVTFDEDDGTPANHIATVMVGPMVRRGRYGQVIDHYNVLRTIEEMYRLPPLGLAARAKPLKCWRG